MGLILSVKERETVFDPEILTLRVTVMITKRSTKKARPGIKRSGPLTKPEWPPPSPSVDAPMTLGS
jgi:hypothetical protein